MTFSLDTTESADEELAGSLLIKEATKRIQAIINMPEWADPAPGSPMAEADEFTPIQPVSYHLRSSSMVAVDNLRATVRYIEETNDVPMMALYSMIRSAVESTSYGLWLLSATRPDKRAFYCLRLSYAYNEDMVSLARAFNPQDKSGAKTRSKLLELHQNLRRYKLRDLSGRVTTTDVVVNADKVVGKRRHFTGIQVWKSCSGLAHGNSAVMPVLLERKVVSKTDKGGEHQLTSRLTFVGGFLIAAVENLEVMRKRYELEIQPKSHH